MRIDSHQHFWKYDPSRDSWIDDSMGRIKRDFLPDELQPILASNHIDACIAIQADQSEEETKFLLNLADQYSFVKGVVGWLDIRSTNIEHSLEQYAKNKKLLGLRHIVQGELEGFLLQKPFLNGISLLSKYGLTYDILVLHHQLPEVKCFVKLFPEQKFVLDHIGKPAIGKGAIEKWKKAIYRIGEYPNVYCKLSGLVTETKYNEWKYEDFVPYMDVVMDAFGIDRVMFGSDWPVCRLSGDYTKVLDIIERYIESFTTEGKEKLMGVNAATFYGIPYS